MIDDITMLSTITETADMGRDSLNHVLEKTTDPQFKSALQKQYMQYDETYKSAEQILDSKGKKPQKAGAPVKLYANMVAGFKTLATDNTTSKIAEMVIEGSTMGVTEMTKQLHNYQGSDQAVRDLAQNHINTEQQNIEEMKKYL